MINQHISHSTKLSWRNSLKNNYLNDNYPKIDPKLIEAIFQDISYIVGRCNREEIPKETFFVRFSEEAKETLADKKNIIAEYRNLGGVKSPLFPGVIPATIELARWCHTIGLINSNMKVGKGWVEMSFGVVWEYYKLKK